MSTTDATPTASATQTPQLFGSMDELRQFYAEQVKILSRVAPPFDVPRPVGVTCNVCEGVDCEDAFCKQVLSVRALKAAAGTTPQPKTKTATVPQAPMKKLLKAAFARAGVVKKSKSKQPSKETTRRLKTMVKRMVKRQLRYDESDESSDSECCSDSDCSACYSDSD